MKLYIDSCINCPACGRNTEDDTDSSLGYVCMPVYIHLNPKDAVNQLKAEGISCARPLPEKLDSIPDWCPLRTQDITLTLSPPISEVDKEPDDDVLI